jgi:hypothetical protein
MFINKRYIFTPILFIYILTVSYCKFMLLVSDKILTIIYYSK